MNYAFSNLLGAPYRGGSLLLHGDTLVCPAGNRVREVELRDATSSTHPFESSHQVQTVALSPDGTLLLTIDTSGRALVVLRQTQVLLHRLRLKAPAAAAAFSPDGCFIAIAVGKLLQIWHTPGKQKVFVPMQLHRTYGGCHAPITAVCWSENSAYVAVASSDTTARVFSLDPVEGFVPPTLTGHRSGLVAVYFASEETRGAAALDGDAPPTLMTISSDGALHFYTFTPAQTSVPADDAEPADDDDSSLSEGSGRQEGGQEVGAMPGAREGPVLAGGKKRRRVFTPVDTSEPSSGVGAAAVQRSFAHGRWALTAKHFFKQPTPLTAAAYHGGLGLLVTAYGSGLFMLHQLPGAEHMQSLSISQEPIAAVQFNSSGEWLALGCATLGQLLVWEWRSETYVLKQQGHFHDVAAVAFSPDGALLASGAEDSKVKVWSVGSGYCFVTFSEHRAGITAVTFTPASNAVLSASLDGTVRAFDLVRYRNFRTFTAPEAVQFACVAVEAGGEIVAAGSHDTFQVFLWNMRTGQLLDMLSGHEGPVCSLAFSPGGPTLASASWDKSVRLWNAYAGDNAPADVLLHTHDVLALAFHPSGKAVAAATLNGDITVWDAREAVVRGTIEARRDMRGGRAAADRRGEAARASSAAFTSLAFSADGSFLIAAGTTKWVCVYDTEELVLLRRFQISRNLALDGILDQLNSKELTEAGPLAMLEAPEDTDAGPDVLVPAAAGGAAGIGGLPGTGSNAPRPLVRCRSLALAPSGAVWAAATTEGILLYALATARRFDPAGLSEDVSLPSAHRLLGRGAYAAAAITAHRLGDEELLLHALWCVPPDAVAGVSAALPTGLVPPALRAVAHALPGTPHLEFALRWVRALCEVHGGAIREAPRAETAPVFRAVQHAVAATAKRLAPSVEACLYKLSYLKVVGRMAPSADAGAAPAPGALSVDPEP